MADATTAAKERVDRALAALERKVLDLKARPASAYATADDDLFATSPSDEAFGGRQDAARIAVLEAAARDASAVLARAADRIRFVLAETPQDDLASGDDDTARDAG